MLRTFIAALAATAAAAAGTSAGPKLEGEYAFLSTALKDGEPACIERWLFEDGVQTVESGEEVARLHFRTETDADGLNWLVRTLIETNGKPDCTGSSAPTPPGPQPESRIYFLVRNKGSVVVCPPPSRTEDGTPFIGDCWGEATPVAKAMR
ncbi:MAG: hypothetical protein QM698_14000 [Micropepsaceae bacterium]